MTLRAQLRECLAFVWRNPQVIPLAWLPGVGRRIVEDAKRAERRGASRVPYRRVEP